MSRSRRHTPICGFSCADSDKEFKVFSSRRVRRRSDSAIRRGEEPEPARAYRLNPYDSPKDGKQYLRTCAMDILERCMRK